MKINDNNYKIDLEINDSLDEKRKEKRTSHNKKKKIEQKIKCSRKKIFGVKDFIRK